MYLYNGSHLFDLLRENICYNVNQTLITFVKYIRHPKQLAARLKARDGLHSKVVTPESVKRETKNGKINAVISTWYMQF